MRRIAEVLKNSTAPEPARKAHYGQGRTVHYGQGREEYERGRAAAPDKVLYDAMCMIRSGWSAEREREYQRHAAVCRIVIPEGEQLIVALEQAVGRVLDQDQRMEEARAKVRAIAAANPYTPPTPPPASEPEPPAFMDDIPPPSDDDFPF